MEESGSHFQIHPPGRVSEMIVTIDGPAGAGKSSVAKGLAARLGFRFLDTGAMYRAVAWSAMQRKLDWRDAKQLEVLAASIDIRLDSTHVYVDSEDVTQAIRTLEVTKAVKYAADNVGVRRQLVHLQRSIAAGQSIITEGRDQGTLVFPDAEVKIFLTAGCEERAKRRQADLARRGEQVPFDEVLTSQNERDRQDEARPYGRLVPAADAVTVCTDGLSIDEVIDRIEQEARRRLSTDDPHFRREEEQPSKV